MIFSDSVWFETGTFVIVFPLTLAGFVASGASAITVALTSKIHDSLTFNVPQSFVNNDVFCKNPGRESVIVTL